ncbi:MAG: hypothetical protein SVC26_09100 [Pseudomonadota bacterium]|nr:hypothetical protein [Pseudomonadota bacterium]
MKTQSTYIYRGVVYTKNANQQAETRAKAINTDHIEKVYRAASYFKLPKVKHNIGQHAYRGVQYMS